MAVEIQCENNRACHTLGIRKSKILFIATCLAIIPAAFNVIASDRQPEGSSRGAVFKVVEEYETAAGSPSARTLEQKKQLEAFSLQIFQESIFNQNQKSKKEVTPRMLIEKFGEPNNRATKPRPNREPDFIPEYDDIVWMYPGIKIEMFSKISDRTDGRLRLMEIDSITISSSFYALKNNLKIGQTKERFISILGPPGYQFKNKIHFEQELVYSSNPFKIIQHPYQVVMEVDSNDHIRKIKWTWYGT